MAFLIRSFFLIEHSLWPVSSHFITRSELFAAEFLINLTIMIVSWFRMFQILAGNWLQCLLSFRLVHLQLVVSGFFIGRLLNAIDIILVLLAFVFVFEVAFKFVVLLGLRVELVGVRVVGLFLIWLLFLGFDLVWVLYAPVALVHEAPWGYPLGLVLVVVDVWSYTSFISKLVFDNAAFVLRRLGLQGFSRGFIFAVVENGSYFFLLGFEDFGWALQFVFKKGRVDISFLFVFGLVHDDFEVIVYESVDHIFLGSVVGAFAVLVLVGLLLDACLDIVGVAAEVDVLWD